MGSDLGNRGRWNFAGSLEIVEQVTPPPNPPEGRAVIWMQAGDNTAGYGTDGDILIKVTSGGTTRQGVIATTNRLYSI